MITKIQKWGNSQGLRLAVNLLSEAHLKVGDEVDVVALNGAIVVSPSTKIRGRYTIEELAARVPEDHEKSECDWGSPVGREVW